MASTVVSSPVLSQCQAVAGTSSSLGYGSSMGRFGPSLSPSVSVQRQRTAGQPLVVAMAVKKKVNAYDDAWTKKFFSYGYFAENDESKDVNLVKSLEKKKLLTNIEKAGLLSKLEALGFSLSQIEKLGLLSKAESLGVLGLVENFAQSSPAALASISLPLIVGAVLTPIIVPDDSTLLLIGQYTVATALGVAGLGTFVASIALGILQED